MTLQSSEFCGVEIINQKIEIMKTVFITLLSLISLTAKSNDMEQAQHVVQKLFAATDERNWKAVENVFSQKVELDYSSMNGNPSAILQPTEITAAWKTVLPGFIYTKHQLSNLKSIIKNDKIIVTADGEATHFLEDKGGNIWTVIGNYEFELTQKDNQFKISKMVFNYESQSGNTTLVNKAIEILKTVKMEKVNFKSEGLNLVGNLFYPKNYDASKTYPAIIVSGSWTTVKEQMAGLYARKLAENGFITLAFDFRNFGESEGQPRFYENPQMKVVDIKNAVTYLESLSEVDNSKIGAFGVCAGAMYTLMASSEDTRIKSVATAASWLHDSEAVKLFYGGEEGVQSKIEMARNAKKKYASTGEMEYIPTISETNESAAMYGPYDYYLNPERGALKEWSDDKFAVASWEDWLTTNPMPSAVNINQPVLMIHSDGAVLPQYTKNFFEKISSTNKKLHWMETELESPYHQFNYYDQEKEVNESIEQVSEWFKNKM